MEKINVLAVDDRKENLLAIEAILTDDDIRLHRADSGQDALALMLDIEFAVVLMDVQMPDMDGFETAELMRGNERTQYTPIIFVTAISKERKHVFRGYESGAVDYIFKPLEPDVLRNKVRVFLDLYRQKLSLKQNIEALKHANQQLLQRQKEKIEEERLKTLFQLAGATAHELNQPLMVLLGSIELMRAIPFSFENREKHQKHMDKVEIAGQRISSVVRKIQAIQQDRTKKHDDQTEIIDIHQIIHVLYVEDDDECFRMTQQLVGENNFHLEQAASIKDALEKLRNPDFEMILLDFDLPDGDGLDFMDAMESSGLTLPVVVLTGMDDEMLATKMIQNGAYDYLAKTEIKPDKLSRAIYNALEKAALKKEVAAVQQRMADLVFTDELTGLFNRRYIFEALRQEIAVADRYQTEISVCVMDLDYFKSVNDSYGHLTGDQVLSTVAHILKKALRQSDIVGRYGGEEFIVILPQTSKENAKLVCEQFRQKIAEHSFQANGSHFQVTASIGIAGNSRNATPEILIERADYAMYQAKSAGRNCVIVG